MMENFRPDYIKIFSDIIESKCPERKDEFEKYLKKNTLSIIDIIELNHKIFGMADKDTSDFNQKHRSYDHETIIKILGYQKKKELSNAQIANHFKLSRNTISKWKKIYQRTKGNE